MMEEVGLMVSAAYHQEAVTWHPSLIKIYDYNTETESNVNYVKIEYYMCFGLFA